MIKAILDWSAVAAGVGAFMKVLPAIAALWTIAWLSISMWESTTVQAWLKRGKMTRDDKVDEPSVSSYVEDDNSNHNQGD